MRAKLIASFLMTLLTAMIFVGCASPTSNTGNTGVDTGKATTTTDTSQQTPTKDKVTVKIENFTFSPADVNVSVGGTVTWINKDGAAHTVTGTNNEFTSGQLADGKSFSFTFTKPGTIAYFCQNHPSMTGTVVVK